MAEKKFNEKKKAELLRRKRETEQHFHLLRNSPKTNGNDFLEKALKAKKKAEAEYNAYVKGFTAQTNKENADKEAGLVSEKEFLKHISDNKSHQKERQRAKDVKEKEAERKAKLLKEKEEREKRDKDSKKLIKTNSDYLKKIPQKNKKKKTETEAEKKARLLREKKAKEEAEKLRKKNRSKMRNGKSRSIDL